MIRIVIADDHAIMRDGLRQIFALESDIELVAEAVNGSEVLALLNKGGFDLLLLDINMPGISGAELITRIKLHQPALPVLVLSMHNDARVASRMLKAGASGYITKDCESDDLLAAIRKVMTDGKYIMPSIAEKILFDKSTTTQGAPHHRLSSRELEIMQLLIAGQGVNEIAAKLVISNKTVSTHKTRLMEKLNQFNVADLMRYAMEHDLLE
jgi:DNA-binding NarL/FixJ family response regulator